ncbi:putative transcription factor bZIP family [Rosa chinensis]|uniref:ABRE binding factor n=2 Tax=Rosa TaxID=3764 RepID=A0A2D1UXF0_ROSHC|nr:bZIP transcription factor 46 [Rosa chinensis]XP_024161874.1 bZIP transcription factor 46 [Rosa chinensis]XP_040364614.1 bZIP transcription factor 46 [Rosa chinensis]ATP66486.1 ABRE binding factor [Rosa hybrid cultivar]PRQ27695.1 putative transcription factor bZIP family [Rosa chinensis]
MGANMNFKGFMTDLQGDGGGRPPVNNSNSNSNNNALARQSSIYSLTFDELQNTMGGPGKDFGSMNMDELLKSIWTAEETQTVLLPTGGVVTGQDGFNQGLPLPLQRQGSLTLPRTLSQKTVDEVWRNLSSKEGNGGPGGSNVVQRQQTLGEMTLEEFLVRAGVVREDGPNGSKPGNNGSGFFGELARFGNSTGGGLGFGFQQPDRSVGVMGTGRISENGNQVPNQSSNLPLNANGVRSQQQQQIQIFPKQQPVTYSTSQMGMGPNSQLGSPGMRGGILGIGEQGMSNALVQSPVLQGGGMGMVGLGGGNGRVAAVSPANQLSSDGIGKSNGTDTSSVSPMPYVFNNGFRGRKGGPVEKVVERRQRRMIKNRESAARSRARKQAYTMELEAEVAKLKEENENLKKKQDEMMELQKNQDMEIQNLQRGGKRRCLRRTQTGPW